MEFFELFTKIANVIYLSVLWLIGCIPVVTIGTSTTAYCYMLNKVVWGKEGYLTRGFIQAFKDNFKTSVKVWLVFALALVVVFCDYYFIVFLSGEYGGMYYGLIPAYILIACLLWAMLIYVFPYMARFEDTMKNTIKNSFLMSTRHFGYTILLIVIDGGVILGGVFGFVGLLLVAPAIIGFVNVAVLSFVFRRYEKQ